MLGWQEKTHWAWAAGCVPSGQQEPLFVVWLQVQERLALSRLSRLLSLLSSLGASLRHSPHPFTWLSVWVPSLCVSVSVPVCSVGFPSSFHPLTSRLPSTAKTRAGLCVFLVVCGKVSTTRRVRAVGTPLPLACDRHPEERGECGSHTRWGAGPLLSSRGGCCFRSHRAAMGSSVLCAVSLHQPQDPGPAPGWGSSLAFPTES